MNSETIILHRLAFSISFRRGKFWPFSYNGKKLEYHGNFSINPVTAGKQLETTGDFSLISRRFSKKSLAGYDGRKKSWVSCLLSIQVSAQLKRPLMKSGCWTARSSWCFCILLPKTLWCWRYWKCHRIYSIPLDVIALNQWVAPIVLRSLYLSTVCDSLRWIRG